MRYFALSCLLPSLAFAEHPGWREPPPLKVPLPRHWMDEWRVRQTPDAVYLGRSIPSLTPLLNGQTPTANTPFLEGKSFVKCDGTNEAAALQRAISTAIKSGQMLLLPAGTIHVSSPIVLNEGYSSVHMVGTRGQSGGTAAATNIQCNMPGGVGTSCLKTNGANYVGTLRNINVTVGPQGDGSAIQSVESGIELTGSSEWHLTDVSVARHADTVHTFINGVKIKDTNGIIWFDHADFGAINGIYITSSAGQYGNAYFWIRGSSSGFGSTFLRVDGFAMGIFVSDSFLEGFDTEFMFSDCGNAYEGLAGGPACPGKALNVANVYITNNGTNYDRQKTNMGPVKISQTNNQPVNLTAFYYTGNRNNCPATTCDVSATGLASGALVRKDGKTVTVSAAGHGFKVGQQPFLYPGETNFPIGYKTVATVPSAKSFTYTETGRNVSSTSTENFATGAFPVRFVSTATGSLGNNVSLLFRENTFAGWRVGVAQVTHPATGPANNLVHIRLQDNLALDPSNKPLNRYPTSCASPNVSCTPSELNCINCTGGNDLLFTTHTPTSGVVTLNGGTPSTGTVTLYEGQNLCSCTNLAAVVPPRRCTTSVNKETFGLTITGENTFADPVAWQCF